MRIRRNQAVIVFSVIAHGILLLILAHTHPSMPRSVAMNDISVSLIDGRDFASISKTSPSTRNTLSTIASKVDQPVEKRPLADILPIFVDDLPTAADPTPDPTDAEVALAVASAASAAAGQVCDLGQWLQQALQADVHVQAALTQIPKPARSVANAMMLWDGSWTLPPVQAAAGTAAIRSAIVAGIVSAPPSCLSEQMRGPILIMLTDSNGATLLVVGSGDWRWQDLLSVDEIATPS